MNIRVSNNYYPLKNNDNIGNNITIIIRHSHIIEGIIVIKTVLLMMIMRKIIIPRTILTKVVMILLQATVVMMKTMMEMTVTKIIMMWNILAAIALTTSTKLMSQCFVLKK